jgi:hypothetical protein
MAERDALSSIETEMYYCEGVGRSNAAAQVFRVLADMECEFYSCWPSEIVEDVDEVIDEEGDIQVGTSVIHDDLSIQSVSFIDRGTADIYFDSQCNGFIIGQSAGLSLEGQEGFQSTKQSDALAIKQEEFAERLFVKLRPLYGWTDEAGENTPGTKKIRTMTPTVLFWANYFGPEYVNAIGRDFLLATPAWKVQEIEDCGIVVVCNESYTEWWSKSNRPAIEHFRAKYPKIKAFRSKGVR